MVKILDVVLNYKLQKLYLASIFIMGKCLKILEETDDETENIFFQDRYLKFPKAN